MNKILILAKHEIMMVQTLAADKIKIRVLNFVRVAVWIKINNLIPQIRKQVLERNKNGDV